MAGDSRLTKEGCDLDCKLSKNRVVIKYGIRPEEFLLESPLLYTDAFTVKLLFSRIQKLILVVQENHDYIPMNKANWQLIPIE